MSGLFGHGDFRLYLLKLLDEEPRHGYELIRILEDETVGLYTPSAGSVYPRLQALEDEGLIEHEELEGRKVYRITVRGRSELHQGREKIDRVDERLQDARRIANEIRDEVRSSVHELRRELRDAAREAGRDARDAARKVAREAAREARESAREAVRDVREHARERTRRVVVKVDLGDSDQSRVARALERDLETFARDVASAARQHRIVRDVLVEIRDLLRDTRERAIEIFNRAERD